MAFPHSTKLLPSVPNIDSYMRKIKEVWAEQRGTLNVWPLYNQVEYFHANDCPIKIRGYHSETNWESYMILTGALCAIVSCFFFLTPILAFNDWLVALTKVCELIIFPSLPINVLLPPPPSFKNEATELNRQTVLKTLTENVDVLTREDILSWCWLELLICTENVFRLNKNVFNIFQCWMEICLTKADVWGRWNFFQDHSTSFKREAKCIEALL